MVSRQRRNVDEAIVRACPSTPVDGSGGCRRLCQSCHPNFRFCLVILWLSSQSVIVTENYSGPQKEIRNELENSALTLGRTSYGQHNDGFGRGRNRRTVCTSPGRPGVLRYHGAACARRHQGASGKQGVPCWSRRRHPELR